MDRLPDELVLQILQYLDETCLCRTQQVSQRLLSLARDTSLWRKLCYASSGQERTRKSIGDGSAPLRLLSLTTARSYWSAEWEPAYPGEHVNYYEEYVHRHAEINIAWKHVPNISSISKEDTREITGLATLTLPESGHTHAICPVDDGSVLIYDLTAKQTSHEIAGHSGPGLLTPGARSPIERQSWMTRGTSIEVVAVDSLQRRSFFAINDQLHEVDLNTLSLISTKRYPLPIATMSTCTPDQPLVIGTSQTVHIYDNRDPRLLQEHDSSHTVLPQPSPASILHMPGDSIMIGGRFTSLLEYSLRYFPRLVTTFHSGGHVSSMTSYSRRLMADSWEDFLNGELSVAEYNERKASPAHTIVSAGAYKGHGSLQLFCRSEENRHICQYTDRHSSGSSKLLSIAQHGAKLVYSDGHGRLQWVGRDGRTKIRTHRLLMQEKRADTPTDNIRGLWGMGDVDDSKVDIAQKIASFSDPVSSSDHTAEKLLLWTGEGRLGVLGLGPQDEEQADEFHDAMETQAEGAAEKARQDAERQYAMAMRRVLERNADEVRFMRGLGMGDFVT